MGDNAQRVQGNIGAIEMERTIFNKDKNVMVRYNENSPFSRVRMGNVETQFEYPNLFATGTKGKIQQYTFNSMLANSLGRIAPNLPPTVLGSTARISLDFLNKWLGNYYQPEGRVDVDVSNLHDPYMFDTTLLHELTHATDPNIGNPQYSNTMSEDKAYGAETDYINALRKNKGYYDPDSDNNLAAMLRWLRTQRNMIRK